MRSSISLVLRQKRQGFLHSLTRLNPKPSFCTAEMIKSVMAPSNEGKATDENEYK